MIKLRKFLGDQKGVAAVEYGLLAALISLSAVTALSKVGKELSNTFATVDAAMAPHRLAD